MHSLHYVSPGLLVNYQCSLKGTAFNFNFETITEWNHYQLFFLLCRNYPLYDKSINPLGIRGVNPSDLAMNQNSGIGKDMYLVHRLSLSSFFLQLLVSMGNHSALQTLETAAVVKDFLASSLGCYFSLHQC